MKASLPDLLARIPGPVSERWPLGEHFAVAFRHGSMLLELYAPVGSDPQTPHQRDEIYIIQNGSGEISIGGERHAFKAGDAFFVAAGVEHRFERFSEGFSTWVVFWGPPGGEPEKLP